MTHGPRLGRTPRARRRSGRAAAAGDDARGEDRPARQPVGRRDPGPRRGRRRWTPRTTSPRCRTSSPPAGRRAQGGEPARPGPPHPGVRQRSGDCRSKARPNWSASSGRSRQRRLGVPALVHEECLTGLTSSARRSTRPRSPGVRPSIPASSKGWPRRSGATWPRSACTRACPPCSTWSATTDGDGSRRRSARIRTWSRCSARPTCAACRAPASSPRSSTSPVLGLARGPQPRPGLDGPTRASRRSSCRRSRRRSREAGAGSVMNSYADIDGVPAGADPWLLTEVLRDRWGFTGTVVSDYWAVPFLATMHRVAADTGDAGALALTAGIDVELPDTIGYGAELVERVSAARSTKRWSTARRDGCSPRRSSSACSTPTGRPKHRSRTPPTPTSTRLPTARWRASWPNGRSSCSTPAPHCPCGDGPPGRCSGSPSSGRAPTTRRRSWGATPSPTTSCCAIPEPASA